MAGNHVRAILVSAEDIYTGTENGLSVYKNGTWTTFDTVNSGICDNTIRALAKEENGRLWIGTENGLSAYYEGIWTTYNAQNSGLMAPVILALLFDNQQNLWIGTREYGGLFRMSGQEIHSYNDLFTLQAYANSKVASLITDNNANVYAGLRIGKSPKTEIVTIQGERSLAFKTFVTEPLMIFHNGLIWYTNTFEGSVARNLFSFDRAQGSMYDAVSQIDKNNMSVAFTSSGRVAWDYSFITQYSEPPQHFEVPRGGGKHTIFTHALWIGGLSNDTILHLAAERYRIGLPANFLHQARDFWPGPVCHEPEMYLDDQEKWNRVWKISRAEIEYHINHCNDPVYQMPEIIENWPVHGDTLKGQEWFIAPYLDINANGIYEPHLGDYPIIRGDQALYLVFNDHRGEHTDSEGNALGVEVRAMAYVFDNPGDSALHHTLFVNYQLVNRSDFTYDSLYMGFFTDFEIGYPWDDYTGCDTLLDTYFGYNALPADGSGQPWAYGENPPAQGITFLNHPLSSFITFFPSPIHPYPFNQSQPNSSMEHYYAMKAIWRDAQPMVHGDYGHPSQGGTERTYHIFPDDPNNPNGWHELSNNSHAFSRNGTGSTLTGIFEPGQRICFDKAFVFGRDYAGDNLSSITVMKERIQQIRDFYTNNIMDDCSDLLVTQLPEMQMPLSNFLKCYPNPVSHTLHMEYVPQSHQATYSLFNAMGALVRTSVVNAGITRISAQDLNPGLYILVVEDGRQLRQQKIIVK